MSAQGAAGGGAAGGTAAGGLEGVVVARTALSDVDGQRGHLTVRGYSIEELAGRATFEEVTYLLWHGALPNGDEPRRFGERIAGCRELPEEARVAVAAAARRMGPMDALRYATAALTADDPAAGDGSREADLERACRLVARVPVLLAAYQRLRRGQEAVEPRRDWASRPTSSTSCRGGSRTRRRCGGSTPTSSPWPTTG